MSRVDLLHNALEQALVAATVDAFASLVADKLAAKGISLTARERDQLALYISDDTGEAFSLRRWRWRESGSVTVEVTEAEAEAVHDRFQAFLDNHLQSLIHSSIEDLSAHILVTLHRTWPRESRRLNRERRGFEKRLGLRWGHAIDLLQMCLALSREAGEMIAASAKDDPAFVSPYLMGVLVRLHARACQVTDEIVSLLRAGFADGAMARWRTLHEIAVIAFFLKEHGEDLARRYVDHEAVEAYRAARIYRECSGRLRYEPMTEPEFEAVRQAYEKVINRYGRSFKEQYGWAADALCSANPSFRDIERSVGIDHLRAHYRMASHNVHANPKGVFFKLGLLQETDVFLAGPSNAGLASPCHSAAISLMHVSVPLGLMRPTLDSLVSLRILMRLTEEVGSAAHEADQQLKEDAGRCI